MNQKLAQYVLDNCTFVYEIVGDHIKIDTAWVFVEKIKTKFDVLDKEIGEFVYLLRDLNIVDKISYVSADTLKAGMSGYAYDCEVSIPRLKDFIRQKTDDVPSQRHATEDQKAILRKIIKKEEEKETFKKEIITEIQKEQKIKSEIIPNRLISKNSSGDYFYNGKMIEMDQETIYHKIFDILFTSGDQDGFISYEDIEKELVKRGLLEIENKVARNKRISNAISKHQGLFRFARVNGKRFNNKTLSGKKLIEPKRGKGKKLNNPII